ncbi:MAG TPA: hypothetical protein VI139_00760 [Gemmatimonadales bacterium]
MRAVAARMLVLSLCAAPLAAQGGMGGGQYTPPPDHWMTMDSLKAALTLTPAELTAIKPQYDSINVVLKQAATVRDSVRSTMQSMAGMSPEDRRAAMAPVRARMEGMQATVDALVKTIRGKLTADQATKLDALPQPRATMRRPQPSGN